jgi:asparagine synthase (glutamine-hydrolysing)
MCGIAGFIDYSSTTEKIVLENMVVSMKHRGPDDFGVNIYDYNDYSVGLGQSRLSIIDLTQNGHQPMTYKHFEVIFNGEIYNYKEIKKELTFYGHVFVTNSDTEVILHSFEEWGIESIHKFIGMFAFVLYDKNIQKLWVVRDRVGVKPLYFYENNHLVLFGSELKALMSHPRFEKIIDEKVLPNYFHYGYIAAPYSIFKNCSKLMPGHYFSYDCSTKKKEMIQYWSVNKSYQKSKLVIAYKEAKSELEDILKSSFQYRMVSDVPVGVFLSGGYDSTAVTAILQANSASKLKTFTIGFEEGNNEAPYAEETASYLGTDHTEYICTTKEAQEIIPTLPFYFDEPFGDSSAIPTILVSQLAKKQVTVALSADGGDEILCGYSSYIKLNDFQKKLNSIPTSLKSFVKSFERSLSTMTTLLEDEKKHQIKSFISSLNTNNLVQAQNLFQSMNEKPCSLISNFFNSDIQGYSSSYVINEKGFHNELELAMAIDFNSYLPNDILTKVDRATMSASLEGREPFLDHRIVEFAASLPLDFKYDGKTSKKILKDIVHGYIPKEMMDRPKTGFSLPIYTWLKGDLSYLIDEYLSEDALKVSGILDHKFLSQQVELFVQNKFHYQPLIWNLLMFQMWYKKWMSN